MDDKAEAPPDPAPTFPGEIPIEHVTRALVGDAAATTDALDMVGYVQAVALFLTTPETIPPLTMSIEGDWGSGKSSFMLQLATAVKSASNGKARVVHFNAWRYEKHEALWAAFALNFLRTLRPKDWRQRLGASLSLLRARLDFEEGAWRIWRTAAMLVALAVVFIVALFATVVSTLHAAWPAPGWLVGLVASGGLGVPAAKHAWKTVGSPFESDLKNYFDAPDYRSNRAFIEMFHVDFQKIVKSYVNPDERVFVFIDDLDRCEIGRAADLLQALNLLMSGEGLPIVYVLGIDREIVSAGVAANWAKQVGYLVPDAVDPAAKARATMRFALDYLEKFVQIPFRVPTPSKTAVKNYIDVLTGAEPPRIDPAGQNAVSTPIETVWIDIGADSDRFRELCKHAAPLLDNNPRRIKQFLNVLRLNAVLAHQRGAFRLGGARAPLTLEQLARFLAIVLRYPAIVADMRDDLRLLPSLEAYALDKNADSQAALLAQFSVVAMGYATNAKLMRFLRGGDQNGRFAGVDFDALLQTVPELKDRWTPSPPPQAANPVKPATSPPSTNLERDLVKDADQEIKTTTPAVAEASAFTASPDPAAHKPNLITSAGAADVPDTGVKPERGALHGGDAAPFTEPNNASSGTSASAPPAG